ncbi:Alkali-sensitive linkage protein 1 [Hypsizygus marmoreus]|uniref:Alkali-sensitive linkage protein 1 n=1 Tax=Hypsizygus marmoreus TaxID=39966 RepID=A0A369JZS7_HYPMA|nr:Alkali-sensitive linkage protein 1 [Hypsizygus marmoreus]
MFLKNCSLSFLLFALVPSTIAANHGLRAKRLNHHHCHHHAPSSNGSLGSTGHEATVVATTTQSAALPATHTHRTTIRATTSNSPPQPVTHSSTTSVGYPISSTFTQSQTTPTTVGTSRLTPNGIKAGIAGGDAYPFLKDHIGWWYDWSPRPSKPGMPIAVPMLWGVGTTDSTDAARLADFKKIKTAPPFVLAYEEPDCPPGFGSAGVSVSAGVSGWESLIVPLGNRGTLIGSPSMCKQADETWLADFRSKISTDWDFTAIHINKNNLAGVKKDIDHYWETYKKPIWVTEFACVNDHNGFVPCTDQEEIDTFIKEIVPFLEANEHVYAYAYSNGLGLGDVWPLMKGNSLSASGRTYLAAISKYH